MGESMTTKPQQKDKKDNSVKNLDLRNMMPFERHSSIFKMWNSLKEGETLRIINDHEPKPLYYLFEAEHKGQFEWKYEKKGPKDWIFAIKKISNTDNIKKQEIKELIKQLKSEKNVSELKKKAKGILKNISPTDLAIIEQEIIQEGTTREEMRKLCDVHLEIMKESMGKTEMNLKPGHPIHTLMEEHKIILDFIEKLKKTVNKLKSAKNFNKAGKELEMLERISEHLIEADKHHQREEEALFPAMEKFGVTEPPEIMKEEHEELKAKKFVLYKTARKNRAMSYHDFVGKVDKTAEYLIKELPNHIYKEDNILYPMAVQVIPKEKWKEIKKKCDKIGYCCFTPGH